MAEGDAAQEPEDSGGEELGVDSAAMKRVGEAYSRQPEFVKLSESITKMASRNLLMGLTDTKPWFDTSLTAHLSNQIALGAIAQESLRKMLPDPGLTQAIVNATQLSKSTSAISQALLTSGAFGAPSGSVIGQAMGLNQPGSAIYEAMRAAQKINGASIIAQAAAFNQPGGAIYEAMRAAQKINGGSIIAQAVAEMVSPSLQSMLTQVMPQVGWSAGSLARAAALEAEFTKAKPYPGIGAGFALLHERIDTSPRLAAEVIGFAETAAAPPSGAFKIRAKDLHERAIRVEQALDEDPQLRDDLAGPLADVQMVSATDDFDVIRLGALLNVVHRRGAVTGIAVVSGLTICLGAFVIGAGTGQPVEAAAWAGASQGLPAGAVMYGLLRRLRSGRSENDDAGGPL
ncbi:hypothetical protein ACRAWC_01595 [Leifsonia sp. L25]|uniref:hypothetical protein n=1 Tax=Actinomycetes TaxID=1760 RepID=UPI003D69E47D